MKSKKSEIAMSTLVILIVILLSAAAMGWVIYQITKTMEKSGTIETCRESVVLASTSRKISGDPMFPLKCDRQELKFKKNEIVKNNEVDQEKVSQMILDSMVDCWYMFGEGKLDPFTSFNNLGTTYCLICKEIKFDDALIQYLNSFGLENNPDYDPFKNSLMMPTSYSDKIPGETQTYQEYLGHNPSMFNGEEDIFQNKIIKDGSLLGLSGMKTETSSNFLSKLTGINILEKETYIFSGSGFDRELATSFTLFLTAPINLNYYDVWGNDLSAIEYGTALWSQDSEFEYPVYPLCRAIIN